MFYPVLRATIYNLQYTKARTQHASLAVQVLQPANTKRGNPFTKLYDINSFNISVFIGQSFKKL